MLDLDPYIMAGKPRGPTHTVIGKPSVVRG